MISALRTWYRSYVHAPRLDRTIYAVLDFLTDSLARLKRFSFPKNYIRRWKLNMLWGIYEKETYALFTRVIRPGMTVVDIGAHIGYFTRRFGTLVGRKGRVIAFEADPDNYALLRKNTARQKNVTPIELALTDRRGTIDFFHYDEKSGAHSTLPNVPLNFTKKKITVTATTLDAWLKENGSPDVDVIKMDIEGGESAALLGMTEALKRVRVLVTEFAPAWIEAAGSSGLTFLKSIESAGFTIYAITEGGLITLSPVTDERFTQFLPQPKKDSHASEFINLYCVK